MSNAGDVSGTSGTFPHLVVRVHHTSPFPTSQEVLWGCSPHSSAFPVFPVLNGPDLVQEIVVLGRGWLSTSTAGSTCSQLFWRGWCSQILVVLCALLSRPAIHHSLLPSASPGGISLMPSPPELPWRASSGRSLLLQVLLCVSSLLPVGIVLGTRRWSWGLVIPGPH